MPSLIMGCGSRDLPIEDQVRLDHSPDHHPDVVWDLNQHPLPFEDATFDAIHAYDILEHLSSQGDWRFWCNEWNEYHRILKKGGHFHASVPAADSPWLWGDPSHTRAILPQTLIFLDQSSYAQVGETKMSDFRRWYTGDFEIAYRTHRNGSFLFGLTAK